MNKHGLHFGTRRFDPDAPPPVIHDEHDTETDPDNLPPEFPMWLGPALVGAGLLVLSCAAGVIAWHAT